MSETDEAPTPVGPTVSPTDLRDWVQFSSDAATRTRVFATDNLAVDVWCLEPRQTTGVIVDEEADIAYTVLGGRSWFVTDQGEIGLDPMGALLVPAGVAHGIDNRGVDALIVLASQSPGGGQAGTPVSDAAAAIRDAHAPGAARRLLGRVLSG